MKRIQIIYIKIKMLYFNICTTCSTIYAIPAPTRGPTATPLKSATAITVPRTSAVVI
jgi:hypothetical protein